jgi:hypothetical protein
MKKKIYGVCCLLLVALAASGLWATKAVNTNIADEVVATDAASTPADLSVRDLALQSELIVTGRCVDTRTAWVENGRILVTLATVSVDEVIKGNNTSTVTVVLPGGADANRRIPVAMTYAGAPTIAPQEDVFLFLSSEQALAGGYAVMGFSQGKFSIVEDEDGQKLVSRDLTKMRLQRGTGVTRGNRHLTPMSEFKQKVRGFLGQ